MWSLVFRTGHVGVVRTTILWFDGSPKAVQELLGHATIEMTMRYAHLSPEVRRSAVQLLDHGNSVAIRPGQLVN